MPFGIFGWMFLVVTVGAAVLGYFYVSFAKIKQERGRAGAILDIASMWGMLIIGIAGVMIALRLGEREEKARRHEIAPKLVFESYPARYDLHSDTLVLDVRNIGQGRAYNLTVGLEQKSTKDSWNDPSRWQKQKSDDPIECIMPDSNYQIAIDLDELFKKEEGFEDLKVYIVYTDRTGMQYLTTSLLMRKKEIHVDIDTWKEFWDRIEKTIEKKEKRYEDYRLRYYDEDVEILEF